MLLRCCCGVALVSWYVHLIELLLFLKISAALKKFVTTSPQHHRPLHCTDHPNIVAIHILSFAWLIEVILAPWMKTDHRLEKRSRGSSQAARASLGTFRAR
jgi:hypothetical protein